MIILKTCVSPGLLIGQQGTNISNAINSEWNLWPEPGPADVKRDLILLQQEEHYSLPASFSSLSSDNVVFITVYNFSKNCSHGDCYLKIPQIQNNRA